MARNRNELLKSVNKQINELGDTLKSKPQEIEEAIQELQENQCSPVSLTERIMDRIKHHYSTAKVLEQHLYKLQNTEAEKVIREAEEAYYNNL